MKQATLLTHLSYTAKNDFFIGASLPLSGKKMPKGRMTGIFGRQAGLKAATYWWKKVNALYNKDLSKVELYMNDTGEASINQSLEKIGNYDILNILLSQTSLTDKLDEWSGDESFVETKYIGDRDIYRKIAKNPDIINTLFERPELSRVKAIVWPAIDPDNKLGYIKMITLRSLDDVSERRVFNFDGDASGIPYKLSPKQKTVSRTNVN